MTEHPHESVETGLAIATDAAVVVPRGDTVGEARATTTGRGDTVAHDTATLARFKDAVADGHRVGLSERRRDHRAVLQRPLIGVPVMADGRPYPGRPMRGVAADLSRGGLGLEFDRANGDPPRSWSWECRSPTVRFTSRACASVTEAR